MYNNWIFNRLNESSGYDSTYSNEDLIEKLGDVDIYDEKKKTFIKMNPSEIMKVCSDALYKMSRDYPYLYMFLSKCKIMYIPVYPSQITNTMAVDENSNLWMNLSFVYNSCKMKSEIAFGILFHEMFHIFFDHCMRFNKKYPKEMFAGLDDAYKRANMKANLCMDYEVNASMVDDGIVDKNFWKEMKGLYKKEYTGMTWEEILDKHGDTEYKEWLAKNGMSLDDLELKILEAIENASKILLDPESDDYDKREARRQLQDKLDELLGKKKSDEKNLHDMLNDLAKSKLGDISNLALELEDLSDDLYKDPSKMSESEFSKTLDDVRKTMDDMADNVEEIANQFGKNDQETLKDIENARKSLNDALNKIKNEKLSKEEKQDLLDKAMDNLEDIISDENEKEKLKQKREERDAAKRAERLEKFKKNHPFRKIINVLNNFKELHNIQKMEGGSISLISKDTYNICDDVINDLEPLTEKMFNEIKKSELKTLSHDLDKLHDSFLPDLVALIDNETILNKTEDDMKQLLDDVFEYVFDAFRRIFDKSIDDNDKASLSKLAAQKLRVIGKILKTQKVWKVGDDFKEAYMSEMKRLMKVFKEDGEEALFKELYDAGVINIGALDDNGRKLLSKITGSHSSSIDSDDEDVEAYEGTLYYSIFDEDYEEDNVWQLGLSDEESALSDEYDVYVTFAKKFKLDFPEYDLQEDMESVFTVVDSETNEPADKEEVEEKLSKRSDYKKFTLND